MKYIRKGENNVRLSLIIEEGNCDANLVRDGDWRNLF
jgi:hypothetical protein